VKQKRSESQRGRGAKEAWRQRGKGPKRIESQRSMDLKRGTIEEGGLRGEEPKRRGTK
jgi:hypothetical protein